MGDYAGAGHVDVHAAFAVALVGPERHHRQFRIVALGAAEVVGVDDADRATARVDRLDHRGVVGERRRGEVGDPTPDRLFGALGAERGDHRRDQALVVDRSAGAQAQLALPLRIGEVLVGRQRRGRGQLRIVDQGARTHRQAEPAVLRVAQVRRDVGLQCRRVQWLQQAQVGRLPKVAGIDGDQHVGLGTRAFGAQALHQRRCVAGQVGDLDSGLGGVAVEQRLD